MWGGVRPILGVPAPFTNFEALETGFSRFRLSSAYAVATLTPFILHIIIRSMAGFNALFTRKVAIW